MMKSFSFAVALLVARTFSVSASSCTGSTPDWMDADGYGCDWYESVDTPGCPLYGNLYGGEMGVANGNCCYCEGTGSVEITMGGILKATNLIVPQTGKMLDLAIAFEQTLLGVLSDSYVCDVNSIGGVQVGSGILNLFTRQRHLQEVVEEADISYIYFNCQVTRPATDTTDAVIMGSQVFEETFDILHWANDGELTTIFCTLADVAQVVPIPCSVEITSVESTSLNMEFVTPPTPSPTSMKEAVSPTRAPSYYPSSYYPSYVPTGAPAAGDTTTTPLTCDAGLVMLEVDVTTDNYPQETSWELVNTCTNQVKGTQTSYTVTYTQYSHTWCLPDAQYQFTINDTWGDGICCGYGNGAYSVIWDGSVLVDAGGNFASSETTTFGSCSTPPLTPPPTTNPTNPVTAQPTNAPTTAQPKNAPTTVSPAGQEPTRAPSYYPSYVPTGAASIPSSIPTRSKGTASGGPTIIPAGAVYYDGFERATFWSTNNGDGAWELTTERAASGIYSIKSPDLSNEAYTPSSSNVTLSFLDPDFEGGTLILSVMPGIVEPFDNLEYFVNGDLRGVLSAPKEDGEFEILEISLGEGTQEITFQYNYNPYSLDTLPPSPPDMIGTVYIDDVYIEPIDAWRFPDPSFTEIWESGDFTANPWILSGDGDWSITDSVQFEGANSATIASTDIASGIADLSIDIISERGGTLEFQVLRSVDGPFHWIFNVTIANVLIDDIVELTLFTDSEDWQAQEISIQPGKRRVTFQFVKDQGFSFSQLWLDGIVFTATA